MRRANLLNWVLFAAIIILISGCAATVPVMPKEFDIEAESFQPRPGKANIYVVRENAGAGSAVVFQILLDGKIYGAIAPGTYFLFEVPQGSYSVASISNENSDSVKIDVTESSNYFVEVKPKFGWAAARVSAELIEQDRGRQLVIDGDRVEPFQSIE